MPFDGSCHMLLQLWDKAQSLPVPAMSRDVLENSPIFFLHGVGFGLVSFHAPRQLPLQFCPSPALRPRSHQNTKSSQSWQDSSRNMDTNHDDFHSSHLCLPVKSLSERCSCPCLQTPYLHFIYEIMRAFPTRPVILLESRHVSVCLHWRAHSTDAMAQAAHDILDKHGWRQAAFIGHSYGTFIMSRIAQLHQPIVQSMVRRSLAFISFCAFCGISFKGSTIGVSMPLHAAYNDVWRDQGKLSLV